MGGGDATGRWARKPKGCTMAGGTTAVLAAKRLLPSLVPSAIIWGGNYFADELPRGGRWLVWDKMNAMPNVL